ncbi:MAG: hypothetical protein EZS28_030893, partial [Streblomastix strix]
MSALNNTQSPIVIPEDSTTDTVMVLLEDKKRKDRIQVAVALGQVSRLGKHTIGGITVKCTSEQARTLLAEMETASDYTQNEFALFSCFGSKDLAYV